MRQDIIQEAAKATPAVGGALYSSLTLNQWVALATLIYIIIQAAVLVHKHYYFVRDKRRQITLAEAKEKLEELAQKRARDNGGS